MENKKLILIIVIFTAIFLASFLFEARPVNAGGVCLDSPSGWCCSISGSLGRWYACTDNWCNPPGCTYSCSGNDRIGHCYAQAWWFFCWDFNCSRTVDHCGSDGWTGEYRCSGDWRQRKYVSRGCSGNNCYETPDWRNEHYCPDGWYGVPAEGPIGEYVCEGGWLKEKYVDWWCQGAGECKWSSYFQNKEYCDDDYCDSWQYYCKNSSTRCRKKTCHDEKCSTSGYCYWNDYTDGPYCDSCGTDTSCSYTSCSDDNTRQGTWKDYYCSGTSCGVSTKTCYSDCSYPQCCLNGSCKSAGTCNGSKICSGSSWINHCGDGACNCGETVSTCPSDCDTSPPTITFNPTSRSWSNTSANVIVTASDPSGISVTYYCWTTGSSCSPSASFSNGATLTQSSNGSWNLCIKARDNANNETTNCSGRYQIDKTIPTVTSFKVDGHTSDFTVINDTSFTISWAISDSGGSNLSRVEVWRKTDGGSWTKVHTEDAAGSSSSGSWANSVSCGHTYQYGLHVLDVAGNMGLEPSTITGTNDCCTPIPHADYKCYNNDVYWYDSCGNLEELKQDCQVSCFSIRNPPSNLSCEKKTYICPSGEKACGYPLQTCGYEASGLICECNEDEGTKTKICDGAGGCNVISPVCDTICGAGAECQGLESGDAYPGDPFRKCCKGQAGLPKWREVVPY